MAGLDSIDSFEDQMDALEAALGGAQQMTPGCAFDDLGSERGCQHAIFGHFVRIEACIRRLGL